MALSFTVRRASWESDRSLIRAVRESVFIREQGIPAELEWDEADETAIHVIALDPNGEAIGTGRLLPSGIIGRMAVLKAFRGQGVGRALLTALLDVARARGDKEVALSAQTRVVGFYERAGFVPGGDLCHEAGIPHQRMRRHLAK
jgi:predicted GNAT family N-acyltransferase